MKNFAKSILNYYAAFNETRFRFGSKLSYEWSNDSFTLDFSVFPVFQKKLIESISLGSPFRFEIGKGEYAVRLESDEFKKALLSLFENELSPMFLEECIKECSAKLIEADPNRDLVQYEGRAKAEGLRQYNLAFRKNALEALAVLQDQKINSLKAEWSILHVPASSFNPQREVQRLFDDLQRIAATASATAYLEEARAYISNQAFELVIFDLHALLRRYLQLVSFQSLYVFYHEIAGNGRKYPLFTVEVNIKDGAESIVVESLRNVVMLNTPAINNFEFDTVLTTPRATQIETAADELAYIEKFLQAKFDVTENFMFVSPFRPLIREGLPRVSYRLGLQAVKEEDRRILDYSELITDLDSAAGQKFIDLIGRYVDGRVQSTADEVHKAYTESFPRKSTERLASSVLSVPMNLNEIQKKILLATQNSKNEIIVVDGPPGTGKSYVIAAMVYLANQMNKSVVITSHKKQALDVIDQMLTDRFKKLHPRSKPAVLRLDKPGAPATLNSMENTLSDQLINGARNRAYDVNRDAVSADRTGLFERIDKANKLFWETTARYKDIVGKAFDLAKEEEALFQGSSAIQPVRLPEGAFLHLDRIRKVASAFQDHPLAISLDALTSLVARRQELPEVLEKCERLNRLSAAINPAAMTGIASVPDSLDILEGILKQLTLCLELDRPVGGIKIDDLRIELPHDFGKMTHDVFLSLKADVRKLAALEGKLFGRMLKSKDIKALNEDLERRRPDLVKQLHRDGTAVFLEKLEATSSYIENTASACAGLTKDYILSGFHQCSPESLGRQLARLESLELKPITDAVGTLLGLPFRDSTLTQIQSAVGQLKLLREYHALCVSIGIEN